MRCPKCQYLSFDQGDRCRNCGYELSLAPDEPKVDVTITRDEPRAGRVDEISFAALETPLSRGPAASLAERDEAEADGEPMPKFAPEDLPLFANRVADDQAPLVTPPAVPRQPIAVRRASSAPRGRPRGPAEEEELAFGLGGRQPRRPVTNGAEAAPPRDTVAPAGVFRRISAGLLDAAILLVIHAAVIYLTLRACELLPDEWRTLPWAPLAAFLLLLSGGYFVLFTAAGGQTIGKMAAGIRVVAVPPEEGGDLRVSFSAAGMRTAASLGSLLFLGAGFLPVLFSSDRRAFHDRVADTRVVLA